MNETAATWLPWRGPYAFESGVETAFHHPLIEFKRPGDAASRCVDPLDLIGDANLSGASWRPMVWGRDGASNRRVRETVVPENIARCEDGYLMALLGNTFEQIFEGVGLSDLGAQRWVEELRQRQQWCAAHGAEYRWFVIPETHAIYPDKVSGCPVPSPERPIMRILRAADPALRASILYPFREMCEGRTLHETCSRDDLHFTGFGAFLCYRALMATLPHCAPDRLMQQDELLFQEGPMIGGFGHTLGMERTNVARFTAPRPPSRKMVNDPRFSIGQVAAVETDFADRPTLVTFRTSNTAILLPFYLRHFGRIVAVGGRPMLYDLIESERPDVVIQEIPERYIAPTAYREGHDPDVPFFGGWSEPFEKFTGFKLPLPRTHPLRPPAG